MSAEAGSRRETIIALRARREALHVASAIALPELQVEKPAVPPLPHVGVLTYLPDYLDTAPISIGTSGPSSHSVFVDRLVMFVLAAGMLSGVIAAIWCAVRG
jgi:hypothetical protein